MKLQPQFSFKTGYEHNSPYHNKFLDISFTKNYCSIMQDFFQALTKQYSGHIGHCNTYYQSSQPKLIFIFPTILLGMRRDRLRSIFLAPE